MNLSKPSIDIIWDNINFKLRQGWQNYVQFSISKNKFILAKIIFDNDDSITGTGSNETSALADLESVLTDVMTEPDNL